MRSAAVLLLVVFCAPSIVQADEAEAVAALFYVRSKQETEAQAKGYKRALPEAKRQLAITKRGRIDSSRATISAAANGLYTFPDKGAKAKYVSNAEKAVKECEDALALVKSGEFFVWSEFKTPLAVGNVGKVDFVLVVIQKLDDNSARVSIAGETCFLNGIDLSKAADGTDFRTDVILEVTGTRTYETLGGAPRTEFVVKPFDMKRVEAIRAKDKP